jgi:hypothetical protein
MCVRNQEDETGGSYGTYTEKESAYRDFVGKPERKNHLEDLAVDVLTMLK